MDDGWILRMKVVHPPQNLPCPSFDNSPSNYIDLSDKARAGGKPVASVEGRAELVRHACDQQKKSKVQSIVHRHLPHLDHR